MFTGQISQLESHCRMYYFVLPVDGCDSSSEVQYLWLTQDALDTKKVSDFALFVLFYFNPIEVSLRSVPDLFGAALMIPSKQVAAEP